jgi:hypothetical protein
MAWFGRPSTRLAPFAEPRVARQARKRRPAPTPSPASIGMGTPLPLCGTENLPAFDLTEHATKARAIRNLGHAVGDHRDRCPCPDHGCRRLVRDSLSRAEWPALVEDLAPGRMPLQARQGLGLTRCGWHRGPFASPAVPRRLQLIGYGIKDIQSEPVCLPSFLELSMP